MRVAVLAAMAALVLAGGARAEVIDKGDYGFRLKTVEQINKSPAQVYRALFDIGRWWNPEHTYSHVSSNLHLPPTANGSFCESVGLNGSARHGVVVLVIPNHTLRLETALGPLQGEGVAGALTFDVKGGDNNGTELTVTYNVGGARPFIVKFAPNVDAVVTEQAVRLKRYVETGRPQ